MIDHLKIRQVLKELCISRSLVGYQYIYQGMILIDKDYSYLKSLTKRLYADIADIVQEEYYHDAKSVDPKSVERGIRTAVRYSMDYAPAEVLTKVFSNFCKGDRTPTSGQFLSCLYDYIEEISSSNQ